MLDKTSVHIDEVRKDEDKIFIQINTGSSVTVVLSFEEFETMIALFQKPERRFESFCSLQELGRGLDSVDYVLEFGKSCVYIRFRMNTEELQELATHLQSEFLNPG